MANAKYNGTLKGTALSFLGQYSLIEQSLCNKILYFKCLLIKMLWDKTPGSILGKTYKVHHHGCDAYQSWGVWVHALPGKYYTVED